jgi:2-polyprenyl-3-methyl-5-hydroxy-6-metoxy-1,4-benzoquinol methylase
VPKYSLNLAHDYTAHALVIGLVGRGKKILEVGCASGYLSKIFKKNRCSVTGVEINISSAELAKEFCDRVVIGSIEEESTIRAVEGTYDVIVLADVLEHLHTPERVLTDLYSSLNEDGFLVVSLPNIANWKIRFNLLAGTFRYTNDGILDKSHLRFYTIKTARHMIEKSGYRIEQFIPGATRMPHLLVRWWPGLFAVHLIFKARKS